MSPKQGDTAECQNCPETIEYITDLGLSGPGWYHKTPTRHRGTIADVVSIHCPEPYFDVRPRGVPKNA